MSSNNDAYLVDDQLNYYDVMPNPTNINSILSETLTSMNEAGKQKYPMQTLLHLPEDQNFFTIQRLWQKTYSWKQYP